MDTETITLEDELIEHNQVNTKQLFELYSDLQFIYPAKMQNLIPYLTLLKRIGTKRLN